MPGLLLTGLRMLTGTEIKMDKDLILKYNSPGPRYTSYPPANHFAGDFTTDDYKECITLSNAMSPENISIYIHIPYCPRLCHFCGCSTTLLTNADSIGQYFDALLKEIENVTALLDKSRQVTQVHWGGGTPNSVPLNYIEQVIKSLRSKLDFHPDAEIAMECSPAYLSFNDIYNLSEIGFNRISLGIQDFDIKVLRAVNRKPSKHDVRELVNIIRTHGFKGVNIDLIYGLPHQNSESFAKTINKVLEIGPDRLVTFSYAHVPWIKSAQKKLEDIGLPEPGEKLEMFAIAYEMLTGSGYVPIGMDHYAKSDDELAIALKNKMLHRNFQGYCTKESTGQVYAFGSTAISQLYNCYAQNVKDTERYIRKIAESGFAIERGYIMNSEELMIGKVINEIMCNGFVDFVEIGKFFGKSTGDVKQVIGYDPVKLQPFIDDELLEVKGSKLQVSLKGMLVVRNIAMTMDPLLELKEKKFSKTI